MPYKAEKIKLSREQDRRVKLTDEQREAFKAESEQKLADIKKLALGAEILTGQLERQVEIKVGDDFQSMMNVEILLEDGKVIAIRS